MTTLGAFAGFAQQGHVDKALDAIVETLRIWPSLASWTNGRITKSRVFGLLPGSTYPQITVAALAVRAVRHPSNELRLEVPAAISVGWEEFDSEAPAGEAGAATMIEEIHRALLRNPFLTTPAFPGERLAERLIEFAPVGLAARRANDDAPTEFALQIEATYQISIDAMRWVRYTAD